MKEAEKSKLGRPGPYAVPDVVFKEEAMRLARKHGVPPEHVPQAMVVGESHIHNEILKAAGSSVRADDEGAQVELWAIARELGVEKEYNENQITPGAFLTLVKRHFEPTQAKEIWLGNAREFGDLVLDLFAKGKISGTSKMNALEKMCEHFVQKDGSPMNARSIMVSLKTRKDYEGK
jgi:hypothetical protein